MSITKTAPERSGRNKILIVVVAVILGAVGYFAFRWIRGLMMLGYVDSAIVRVRVLSAAETQFAKMHPEVGYTCSFSQLLTNDEIVRRIAESPIENGYAFEIAGCRSQSIAKPNATYYLTARPLNSGQPAYCSDQSGVLKVDYDGSVERCRKSGVPL